VSDRLLLFGRLLFATGCLAFGVLHFVYGDFVTRVVSGWPAGTPGRMIAVYLVGGVLVATGAAVVTGFRPRVPLAVAAAILAISFLGLGLPAAITDLPLGGNWTTAGKGLVLLGGCFAVAVTTRDPDTPSARFVLLTRSQALAAGRTCLALFLILGGVQHLRWSEFVGTLVPGWVPGGAVFWTYASAVLLIAGGAGMLVPRTARLAALLSGVMIFLWVFMLHIPRAVAGVGSRANETTAVFEALAFSGLAFIYAATASRRERSPSPASGHT
jgi:uncharacterized membrane protein